MKSLGMANPMLCFTELASYCVHALAGAGAQRSKAAVRRLVSVTRDGLRPPG